VGLGVGAGLGISACASQAEPAPCGQLLYLPVVFTALVGMLTGTVVDAAIRKTLYRGGAPRAGRASVTLAPLIDTRTTGASLNVRF